MTPMQDERLSGDLPVSPTAFAGETGPSLSHEVVATYVADAARSIPGILHLHASHWKGLSSRVRESHTDGVVIKEARASVDVEIHAKVAWGVSIPELARKVEEAVRNRVSALLSLDLGTVTLFVDAIAGPMEAGLYKEG